MGQASAASLFRRFFSVTLRFSDKEESRFIDVDLVNHVALVVVAEEEDGRHIVGEARYVVVKPGQAEVAFGIYRRVSKARTSSSISRFESYQAAWSSL